MTINVAYAGINFVDVMARRGDAAYASAWPYAPGLEVSGAVLGATGGAGVDVVLDPQGTAMLETDLVLTAPGGRMPLVGHRAAPCRWPAPGP